MNDVDEDEHVLVLDFLDNSRGVKSSNTGFAYTLPPALSPAATKRLVEKRNDRFVVAVNELVVYIYHGRCFALTSFVRLLKATPQGDDPVALLQAAARDHLPVHPGRGGTVSEVGVFSLEGTDKEVPEPGKRPSIEEVICKVEQQEWYQEQITYKRVFGAREGRCGMSRVSLQVDDGPSPNVHRCSRPTTLGRDFPSPTKLAQDHIALQSPGCCNPCYIARK